MKKLALLALLIAAPALAQEITVDQLEAAKRAVMERDAAARGAAADAAEVATINLRVDMKQPADGEMPGDPRDRQSTDVVIKPGDPEFDAVLAAAKSAYARKAVAEQKQIDDSGIAARGR